MAQNRPRTIQVNVTRDMIHWAVTQTSTQCAIALAIRDADPDGNFMRPHVDQDRISFTDTYTQQRVTFRDVPKKLQNWIDQFDRDPSKCRPFSFTLDLDAAETRPMQHLTPLESVKAYQRNQEVKVRRQKKIPVSQSHSIRNTSKRELRDVEVPEGAGKIA